MNTNSELTQTIRNTALALGAIPIVFVSGILWSDRFVAFDEKRTLSVRQALDEGLLQGFFVLNALLLVAAMGIWHRRNWARWLALAWFPLLATHNIVVEFWHSGTVARASWQQAGLISAIWIFALYPALASRKAAGEFGRGDTDDSRL